MTAVSLAVRDFLATGPLGHVVTLNPDGTHHVTLAWVGVDDDELVWSSFLDQHKLESVPARSQDHDLLPGQRAQWRRAASVPGGKGHRPDHRGRGDARDGLAGQGLHRTGGDLSQPGHARRFHRPCRSGRIPVSAPGWDDSFRAEGGTALSSITKTIRLSGQAADSIEDAVRTVLARAASTISDIQSFRIVEVGGSVDDSGVPTQFSVTLDITFGIKDPVEHGSSDSHRPRDQDPGATVESRRAGSGTDGSARPGGALRHPSPPSTSRCRRRPTVRQVSRVRPNPGRYRDRNPG